MAVSQLEAAPHTQQWCLVLIPIFPLDFPSSEMELIQSEQDASCILLLTTTVSHPSSWVRREAEPGSSGLHSSA